LTAKPVNQEINNSRRNTPLHFVQKVFWIKLSSDKLRQKSATSELHGSFFKKSLRKIKKAPISRLKMPISSDKQKKKPQQGGIPYRSKLVPFAQQIAVWQREGKTYRQMSELLKEQGVDAHHDTINAFVLSRVRGRKRAILPAEYLSGEEVVAPPVPAPRPAAPTPPSTVAKQPFTPFTPATPAPRPATPAKKSIDSTGKAVVAPYVLAKPEDL
jgi:hypothetical protein